MRHRSRLPRRALASLVLLAAAVGCAARAPSIGDLPSRDLAGHLTSGPDASWFRPCDAAPADSAWWVTYAERAVAQRATLRAEGRLPDGERRFARVRGAVSTRGEIGPRGPGAPALLLRELVEVRPPAAGDCATP